jgi:serine protease AprX
MLLRFSLLALSLLAPFAIFAQTDFWHQKVDARLLERLAGGGAAEFLVVMQQQADLRAAEQFRRKDDKGRFVYETCVALAESAQPPVRNLLKDSGAPVQSFWVVNALWSKGDAALVEKIARLPQVARVEDNPVLTLQPLPQDATQTVTDRLTAISWGLTKINADDVWALGYRGATVVMGGQDTGYEWQHPAIKNKYRGWDGSTADHNYNWHDAIHALVNGGTNSCGLNLTAPCDDHGHGTHTAGTMAGGPATDSIIGVAPEARWMGCRNMEEGDGTPATYIECFEWFIAPTNTAGNSPNTAMAPHVINNSWGCPTSEGCNSSNYATMETVVNNVRAAGILVVVSAGNDGSGCSTVNSPAPIYTGSFSVGATNSSDGIASFSSRGPVTVYGNGVMKPNISAPGVGILSCVGTDNTGSSYGYASWNGTSMAGPHVAGVAALIMSARPDLKGNVNVLEDLMETTALPRYATSPFCGNDNASSRPNNVYGWGRLDALAAVNAALALPVELLDFSAENRGAAALLRWRTAVESGCAQFDVQRSSDALGWFFIGKKPCAAPDGMGADYDFWDENPLPGTSYYRLRQSDMNGAAAYSPVALLHRPADRVVLRAVAQPRSQTLWLDIAGAEPGPDWSLELHAMDGRLVHALQGPASGAMALPALASGLYTLHLRNERGQALAVERVWWR